MISTSSLQQITEHTCRVSNNVLNITPRMVVHTCLVAWNPQENCFEGKNTDQKVSSVSTEKSIQSRNYLMFSIEGYLEKFMEQYKTMMEHGG